MWTRKTKQKLFGRNTTEAVDWVMFAVGNVSTALMNNSTVFSFVVWEKKKNLCGYFSWLSPFVSAKSSIYSHSQQNLSHLERMPRLNRQIKHNQRSDSSRYFNYSVGNWWKCHKMTHFTVKKKKKNRNSLLTHPSPKFIENVSLINLADEQTNNKVTSGNLQMLLC